MQAQPCDAQEGRRVGGHAEPEGFCRRRRPAAIISKLLYAFFLPIMCIFLFTQKIRTSVVCVNKTPSTYFLCIFCVFMEYIVRI
jgi:hypothetical protein